MFILDMIKADRYNTEADRINLKALNSLSNAEREVAEQKEKTFKSLEKLANRKKGILTTSINEFIQVYEQIMNINFVESDDIRQLSTSKNQIEVVGELRDMLITAGFALSAEQNISTFIFGFVKGGALGGFSNIIAKEAELNVATAKKRKKQATVAASQAEAIKLSLEAIYERSERLTKVLTQLNKLFRMSLRNTEEIISKNGRDRLKYSIEDKQDIRNCWNFADAIRKLLDAPLLDTEGEITDKSLEAIEMGENFMSQINGICAK